MRHFSRLYCLLCFSLLVQFCQGQEKQTLREITGSFRFKNDIYTYTCQVSKNGATIKSRKITNNSTADTTLQQGIKSVQQTLSSQLTQWGGVAEDTLLKQSTLISKAVDTVYNKLGLLKTFLDSVNNRLDTLKAKAGSDSLKNIIAVFQAQVNQVRSAADKTSSAQLESPSISWDIISVKGALYSQLQTTNKTLLLSDNDLNTIALEIFYKGEAIKEFTDDAPITANMTLLNDHIPVYIKDVPLKEIITQQKYNELKALRDAQPEKKLKAQLDAQLKQYDTLIPGKSYIRYFKQDLAISLPLDKIQVEFDKGTIKNIIASFSCDRGYKNPRDIGFRNNMPISISGKFDNDFFSQHWIFAYNPSFIQKAYDKEIRSAIPTGAEPGPGYQQHQEVYFKLDELISYSITLENNKEDYSPADATYVLTPIQPTVTLRKQLRSQILTVKAFTDFMGINKEASNGLIQFEANLNANFLTRRIQRLAFFPSKYTYQGFLTAASVNGMLTKIEENNKFLILGTEAVDNNALSQGKKAFFVSPIDLYRYKSNAIDFSLQVWKFNIPQVKSNFQLNGRFGVSRSNVADSLELNGTTLTKTQVANERMVTFAETNFCAQYEFTSDSRYSFHVGYGMSWLHLLSEDIKRADGLKGRINTFFIGGFLATGSSSKVFFRWRLNYQAGDRDKSFNQVQLGYLVDIFGAKQ